MARIQTNDWKSACQRPIFPLCAAAHRSAILTGNPSLKEGTMKHEDFIAIEGHIRRAQLERHAYLGALTGSALAAVWKFTESALGDLRAALQGAKAGVEEHRRRRTMAAAHAAH
jgi:hypothetical protein